MPLGQYFLDGSKERGDENKINKIQNHHYERAERQRSIKLIAKGGKRSLAARETTSKKPIVTTRLDWLPVP